jgi:alkylation response protein AidB-like acyl-CoA dehydrogenase
MDQRTPHSAAHPEAFRAEVRDFASTLPATLRHKVMNNLKLEKEDYVAYLKLLQARGWIVGHWPAEYGGCDWTPLQRFIFEEETSEAGAPWLIPFGVNYVGPILYTFGSQAQKDQFLPRIRSSEDWWAQGYSEPGAGSDLAGLRTLAVREGDHYVVTGQKIWTTYAQWADWMFCLARTSQEERPQKGISFLLIDMKSPGVTVRPIITMDMCHDVNEVFLDQVRVPLQNLVGEEGGGWTYAKVLLGNERVLVAEVGRSTRQLRRLEAMAASTLRGARPLRDYPPFARRLAELKLRHFVLQSTCYQAVAQAMAGSQPGAEASLMKIRGSELQQDIAEAMVDALGLAGIVYDASDLEGMGQAPGEGPFEAPGILKDHLHGRAATIYGGSNEIQRNIIAKMALGL